MAGKSNTNYRGLRARLIEAGWTLRRFAIERGYAIPTVYSAAAGRRSGVISVKIRRELKVLCEVKDSKT